MLEQSFNQKTAAPLIAAIDRFRQEQHRNAQRPGLLNRPGLVAWINHRPPTEQVQAYLDRGFNDLAEVVGEEVATKYMESVRGMMAVEHIFAAMREDSRARIRQQTDFFVARFQDANGWPREERRVQIYHPELESTSQLYLVEIHHLVMGPNPEEISINATVRLHNGWTMYTSLVVEKDGRWKKLVGAGTPADGGTLQFHDDPEQLEREAQAQDYIERTGGHRYTSTIQAYMDWEQQRSTRWMEIQAAEHDQRIEEERRASLPRLDEQAGIVRPAPGQPGFDPQEFERNQRVVRANQRKELTTYVERAKEALAQGDEATPAMLAHLAGKLRKFTLQQDPNRVPQAALVNDLQEELRNAEAMLAKLTQD